MCFRDSRTGRTEGYLTLVAAAAILCSALVAFSFIATMIYPGDECLLFIRDHAHTMFAKILDF